MGIVEFIRSLDGIAHRRSLLAAGFSRHRIRTIEQSGGIRRVRRDWFMTPGCDELLYRSAIAGGTLGCISAAKHSGLWVTHDDELHISASAHSGHVDRSPQQFLDGNFRAVTVHWRETAAGVPRVACETLEMALLNIAECQTLENAVATFDSALNTAQLTPGQLEMLASTSSSARMRAATALCDGRADSGIESIPRVRLALLGIEMVPQVRIDGHPVDGLIGERLVLQFDGYGPHRSRTQRDRDLRQDARLTRDGYAVLRFSYDAVMFDWPTVEALIMSARAQGRHRAAA